MSDRKIMVAIWLLVSLGFNYPAIFASAAAVASDQREAAGVSMAFALIPVAGTAVAIFGTGFCEHGFKWIPE